MSTARYKTISMGINTMSTNTLSGYHVNLKKVVFFYVNIW